MSMSISLDSDVLLVQIFYNGLIDSLRASIDVAVGGTIIGKSPKEACDLFEEMASDNYQCQWGGDPCDEESMLLIQ